MATDDLNILPSDGDKRAARPASGGLQRRRSKTSSIEREANDLLPMVLRTDSNFMNSKTFGNKKDINALNKWYDMGRRQILLNVKYTEDQRFEYQQNIFKMALEAVVAGSNEDFPTNAERLKMITRVWNDNAESLQKYIGSLHINPHPEDHQLSKHDLIIDCNELRKKVKVLETELKNSLENVLHHQREKSDLLKKNDKLKEEFKKLHVDLEAIGNPWFDTSKDPVSGALTSSIKTKIDRIVTRNDESVDTRDLGKILKLD
jgi:hypothetical protein